MEKVISFPSSSSLESPHFVIFPFMSKGHTIPLLHLACLLHRRGISITFISTPFNSPSIRRSLSNTNTVASIIDLPFPDSIPGLPPGVQSTDQLPSDSLIFPFIVSTKLLQPHFEQVLRSLPHVSCIISDGFLSWTLESATKLGIPRVVSYGTCAYSTALRRATAREFTNQPLVLKSFSPWIKITEDDLGSQDSGTSGPGIWYDLINEVVMATSNSWGILFNSFYEMETAFVDYWNREFKPKAWCVGPLCLVGKPKPEDKPMWMQWLDTRAKVLYVAFGTQVNVCAEQMREIAVGLEGSGVDFLWVVRSKSDSDSDSWLGLELEGKVKERGLIMREWVDQTEILRHESISGFLSHCGWNSVSESICASVPILAWPMMAEQFLNAKMVVEELGIGLRIPGAGAGDGGLVKAEVLQRVVRELMVEEKGKKVAEKVRMVGEEAKRAMTESGSSSVTLDLLITEVLHYSAIEKEKLEKAHGCN
ncbi:UDP-glycosyltransferase 90A1-like [Telopea speciosissima]|uniref:UDP-glycosyltransferase 90A1-like n=1 Tax=Telopea speciosissima TaxID=54955 RepID=UPI001CC65C43|nr:UDP-glycosyltransferase 90A1-like [Telopea speciosissima]